MDSSKDDSAKGRVTALLAAWQGGDQEAGEDLVPLVYAELRKIAGGYLKAEKNSPTWQPTALAHEAYLRLVDQQRVPWQNRSHFFGIAAQMIRRILVDNARRRLAAKRGGDQERVPLEDVDGLVIETPEHVLDLERALLRLEEYDPTLARLVELRYFAGLTGDETAATLGCSPATVKRNWRLARTMLQRELASEGSD